MRKLSISLAALTICFAVTIQTFNQKKGGSSSAAVYLKVQIDDSVSQGVYGIGSDGGGAYNNGGSGVAAQFTKYGYLDFNSGSRVVNAFYSTVIEATQSSLPPAEAKSAVTIKTHGGSNYLQNMPVGEARCVQTSVNFNEGIYTRTIGYNAGYGTISNTGYVKVTHPDTNTWIMESNSAGGCTSQDGLVHDDTARIRDHKISGKTTPDIDYGRFYMPMRLILTRQ